MSSQTATPNTEAAILARLIQMGQGELSRGAAEYLLSIRFDDRDTARMNELSEFARQGQLTSGEQSELDTTSTSAISLPRCSPKREALCSVLLLIRHIEF